MREVTSTLWIGNAAEARDLRLVLDAEIEAIVDLAAEEPQITATRDLICCRIPISDDAENPPTRIRLAIRTIAILLDAKTRTLVTCGAGISRSPAIVAAALSQLSQTPIDQTLRQIAAAGPCDVSPALLAEIVAVTRESGNDAAT